MGPANAKNVSTRHFTIRIILSDMENSSDEISLNDILAAIKNRRYLILCLTILMTLTATLVAFIIPEKFEVSVVLAPADDDASGKMGAAGAVFSQLGGLAGISALNGAGAGKRSEYIATLQSHALTEAFISDLNLLPTLYPSEWDNINARWKDDLISNKPTIWKAEKKFSEKIRAVSEDKKTGLVTLTITWSNPDIAAQWAAEIVKRTNAYLKSKAIARSNANLQYLNEQLGKTSVVELQKAIYTLIEAEIKKIMVANGSDEYAFRVIDPARPPEERSSPKRLLIASAGLFGGVTLGVFLALILPPRKNI